MTTEKKNHPIKDIRRAGVPLVLYSTADPAETIRGISAALNGAADSIPVCEHDLCRGLRGMNTPGNQLVSSITNDTPTTDPTEALNMILSYAVGPGAKDMRKAKPIFYFHMAHNWIGSPIGKQAVWNLRDPFAALGCTLIMLATGSDVPAELRQDVITLTDPLPTPPQIADIIGSIADAARAGGAEIDPGKVRTDEALHDTLTGLSGFGAKQVFAMAVRKDGLAEDVLGERKRKLVEQTKGLSIWEGGESFDELGGLGNLKEFLTGVLTSGKTPVRAIGFIDEIEKMFAAAGTDTSGTSQDQLQVFLRVMQDDNMPGIIILGPPGTGKSAISKAAGRLAKSPVISFDLGAAKDSLVGGSEARIRAMMEVFKAVSQGKGLFIATCNGIQALPPELRRRFKLGTFFVDLPSAKEQESIWRIWLKKFGLPAKSDLPGCEGWTGAEIAACCEIAYRTGQSLKDSANYIVPVCKAAAETINALRRNASGRFISASKKGMYQMDENTKDGAASTGRAMSFD